MNDENENAAGQAPEQAADWAALEAAAQGSSAASVTAEQAQPVAAPELAEELAGIITMAVATISPIFPSLKDTYTKEVTAAAAGAIGAVCKKHGWLQGGMFGEYGEEVACLAIVGPLAFATYTGIKADLADKAKAAKIEKTQQIQAQQGGQGAAVSSSLNVGGVTL